jgi:hypothetical protein
LQRPRVPSTSPRELQAAPLQNLRTLSEISFLFGCERPGSNELRLVPDGRRGQGEPSWNLALLSVPLKTLMMGREFLLSRSQRNGRASAIGTPAPPVAGCCHHDRANCRRSAGESGRRLSFGIAAHLRDTELTPDPRKQTEKSNSTEPMSLRFSPATTTFPGRPCAPCRIAGARCRCLP